MKKVFSFVELFNHTELNSKWNITEFYKDIKDIHLDHAGTHDGVTFTRIARGGKALVVAHRLSDHKTWLSLQPTNERTMEWKTRTHSIYSIQWDLTFISPEMSVGLRDFTRSWATDELTIYPQIFSSIYQNHTASIDTFKQLINDSIIEVENVYDVFFHSYEGKKQSKRKGDYVFITGQENEKLLSAVQGALNKIEDERMGDIHLFPYLGTLINQADFDTLTTILQNIGEINQLTPYSNYTFSTSRVGRIQSIMEHIETVAENKCKDLMKSHVQTVSMSQLLDDETIQENIEQGAKVNILIDIDNMKWVG